MTAFQQTLQTLGWTPGRNLWIDYRWGAGNIEKVRAAVTELLGIRPDVIVADGMPALRAFHQTSTNLPIVFTIVSEPVAAGFVESSAHPGGNITGPLVDQVIGLLLAALHGIVRDLGGGVFVAWRPQLGPRRVTLFRRLDDHARRIRADPAVTLADDGRSGGS